MAASQVGGDAPVVTEMLVIPVAGQDSMLLNLCGAHGPFFTRNIVVLKDVITSYSIHYTKLYELSRR